jgi:hypothetical protein
MCGARSAQTIAPDLTSDGPADLDGRPDESLRSALQFTLDRCPSCGYVAPADELRARTRKRRAALAGLLDGKASKLSARNAARVVTTTGACQTYWCGRVGTDRGCC